MSDEHKISNANSCYEEIPDAIDDGFDEDTRVCPICLEPSNVFLNIGRTHISYCEKDKTAWVLGENLFSAWRDETPDTWAKNQDFLAEFTFLSI
jgi:hypothetical protein